MATTFINGIAIGPGRTQLQTAKDSIEYITNPEKTDGGRLVTGFRCSPEKAYFEMLMEQHEYERQTGRKVIQNYKNGKLSYMLMTMRQSFAPGEVTPEQAHEIGCKLAKRFLGEKYQYVVATHVNTHCIHNHITFNMVGSDLKKFRQTKYTPEYLRRCSDRLCDEYNLTVVVPSQEWQKRKYTNEKQTSFRTILKSDIDSAVEAAHSYEEFLKIMEKDYRIGDTGKYLKFRHRTNGQQEYIRSYTLGSAYTEKNIRARIAGLYVERSEQLDAPPVELQTISYSQRLRNIEAMLNASGFVNEYGTDFDSLVTVISQKASEVKIQIDDARQELEKAEFIMKCFETVEEFQPVADEYESSLLKDRFRISHQSELDLYDSAAAQLTAAGINPAASKDQYIDNVLEIKDQLSDLMTEYDSVQSQIDQVEQIRKVIEKVNSDEQILTERKRGKSYGR
jgi:hypothetical protein